MSGVKGWRVRNGGVPLIRPYFVRASQDFVWGDILALGSNTLTNRVFAATSTEVDFQNASAVAGLLGFSWQDFKADADGQLVQSVPSTVETGAAVIHPVPNYSRLMHRASQPLSGTTPDKGNYQVHVCIFTDDLEILLDVCNNGSATTVDQTLVGNDYGLILDGTQYKLDVNVTSGDAAQLVVVEVDTAQLNFNSSAEVNNAVWCRVKPGGQQYLTGLLY